MTPPEEIEKPSQSEDDVTDNPEEKLNAKQAMAYLDITHATFYRRLVDPDLPIPYHQHKVKRDKIFYKSELDDYVKRYNEPREKKNKKAAE